jgi:hypothetical protein
MSTPEWSRSASCLATALASTTARPSKLAIDIVNGSLMAANLQPS